MHARKADGFAIRTSFSTASVTEILAPPTETAIEDSTATCCWKSVGPCNTSARPDHYTGHRDSISVHMCELRIIRNSLFDRVFLVSGPQSAFEIKIGVTPGREPRKPRSPRIMIACRLGERSWIMSACTASTAAFLRPREGTGLFCAEWPHHAKRRRGSG